MKRIYLGLVVVILACGGLVMAITTASGATVGGGRQYSIWDVTWQAPNPVGYTLTSWKARSNQDWNVWPITVFPDGSTIGSTIPITIGTNWTTTTYKTSSSQLPPAYFELHSPGSHTFVRMSHTPYSCLGLRLTWERNDQGQSVVVFTNDTQDYLLASDDQGRNWDIVEMGEPWPGLNQPRSPTNQGEVLINIHTARDVDRCASVRWNSDQPSSTPVSMATPTATATPSPVATPTSTPTSTGSMVSSVLFNTEQKNSTVVTISGRGFSPSPEKLHPSKLYVEAKGMGMNWRIIARPKQKGVIWEDRRIRFTLPPNLPRTGQIRLVIGDWNYPINYTIPPPRRGGPAEE